MNYQKTCFEIFKTHYKSIAEEYQNHKNPTYLDQHDFSDGADTYVEGTWYAVGISSEDRKVQEESTYPILYSILDKFPYKMNCAFMVVKPNTTIGNHKDKEGGWRYQLTIDDGGGDNSGINYTYVNEEGWPQQETHIFKNGNSVIIQPGKQLHNGWNKNPRKRVTLLLDFYDETVYNKKDFIKYRNNYNDAFNSSGDLCDIYEGRKVG